MTKITSNIAPVLKTNLFTDQKQLDKALDVFAKKALNVQTLAHRVALSVLHHAGKHADPSYVTRVVSKLMAAMPEMSRKASLLDWMNEFGSFSVAEVAAGQYVVTIKAGVLPRLGDADAKPFWKFRPEAIYKPLDPDAFLEMAIKKFKEDALKTGRDMSSYVSALSLMRSETAMEAMIERASGAIEQAPVVNADPLAVMPSN